MNSVTTLMTPHNRLPTSTACLMPTPSNHELCHHTDDVTQQATDAKGRTALIHAAVKDNDEAVAMLLEHSAVVDALDIHGATAAWYRALPSPAANAP
jgi:ankyrin repeat protein